jgi:VWFA-related protein
MKRRLIFAGLIAAMALSASGTRRVTVAQLDEVLTSDDAAHRPDLDAARQIGEMEMTERLTERSLGHLAAAHKLGPRTALALQLLSDQSAFLDPPAAELPATGAPDDAEQQRMLDAARAYSVQTWSRMPNFFVTRATNRFDDAPHVLVKGDWPVRAGLQPVGSLTREVTFRDGKEVQDEPTDAASSGTKDQQELGLHSWGEFGPALFVVLSDAAKGKITFSHWEETGLARANSATGAPEGTNALAAVYRYSVPHTVSHYGVNYCCIRDAKSIGNPRVNYGNDRGRSSGPSQYAVNSVTFHPFVETPGYHGTISIDPATGTVLRITIEAELSRSDPLMSAATAIEYGPVRIGESTYFGPVHSIALSVEDASMASLNANRSSGNPDEFAGPAWNSPTTSGTSNPITLINETRFLDYHRLGSTARILTDTAAGGAGAIPSDAAASPGAASAEPSSLVAAPDAPADVASAPSASSASTAAMAPEPPPPPAEPVIPEISMSAASGVPDQAADAPQQGDETFSLKVTSRLVDVGLVAYDKKGHPVTDLKPDELEVYDNGHKQEIRSFGLADNAANPAAPQASAASATAAPERQEPLFSNRATEVSAAAAPVASDIGSTILVIDESHIAWSDLSYARGQILKFLGALAPSERVGLYSMSSLGFRILSEVTTDHATLIAQMRKFMPSSQSLANAQDEEMRNRQHFDEVHNIADLNSVNGNHTDASDGAEPIDPQLLKMGDDPTRASFVILTQVARHLASIPGHKKLVWVSSDNVLADWRDQTVGVDKTAKDDSAYALHAQEALNEAHAAVYPFDVSQLEVGGVGADLQHSNVQLAPAVADNAATAAAAGASSSTVAPVNRDTSAGRIAASMSQDLHPVQGPVREVAAATGGRVIRRAGDLSSQLDRIVADGHATYMLSFTPQGSADGQYHTINVKLTGRKGLTLSYRMGYVFDKEPSSLKERFQQAIWRPVDMSEIAVSANVTAASDGASVKINIATRDLGMRQQAGRWLDRLDIFFIQRDDAGLHARVEGQSLGLKLKSTTYEKLIPEGVPFQHFVAARPGMASLRVLVVDENSGRMGSITIPSSAMNGGQGE